MAFLHAEVAVAELTLRAASELDLPAALVRHSAAAEATGDQVAFQ